MTIDYTQTPNYGLDKYGDKSPADLRDGFNHNMDIIDDRLKLNADNSQGKANKSDVYAKDEVDDRLSAKADRTSVYTKSEVDSALHDAKVNTDNAINAIHHDIMVWIGDSWSDASEANAGNSDSGAIPRYVSTALNMSLKNFAKGGSGIVTGGANSFSGQAKAAVQDSSFKNSDVGMVVVFGGVNDRHSMVNQNEIDILFQTLTTNFPNARVVCIPMQKASNGNDWGNTKDWVSAYLHSSIPGVSVVGGAWYWSFGRSGDFMYTNPGHPRRQGCITTASRIITALTGGQPMGQPMKFSVVLNKKVTSESHLDILVPGNGDFIVRGMIVFDGTNAVNDYIGQIPDGFRTATGAVNTLFTPQLAQYNGLTTEYINFIPDPYRNAPADYVGSPQAFQMFNIKSKEAYWIDKTFEILR